MKRLLIFNLLLFAFSINAQWMQQGMDLDGENAADVNGWSVSINAQGTIVAVGAPYNDEAGDNSGHVRVYEWDGFEWSQNGMDIDGELFQDYSGTSISLNSEGSKIAIGAPFNDGGAVDAGHVRVYEWINNSWNQLGSDIDGELFQDRSGTSVSLNSDGNILAIGSPYHDGVGNSSGNVRIFEWDGISWNQVGSDIDGVQHSENCGQSVALNDNGHTIVIGSSNAYVTGYSTGYVKVYQWDGASWIQKGLEINGEAAGDQCGRSVSINSDGNVIAIGAYRNDGIGVDAGHVRIFQWDGNSWVQRGSDIEGEAPGDEIGFSISLNSAGDIIAIGGQLNDENGADSGHTRTFSWDGSSWNQIGSDIYGLFSGDESGNSVALDSLGNSLIIGAFRNDNGPPNGGSEEGHARVFNFECQPNSIIDTQLSCDIYTWNVNGQTYTQSGQYTEVLTNQDGCDSTITLELTITNSNVVLETVTECDSYIWNTNGQTYTQSGQYTEVLFNQDGCDSTVTLDLTINSSSSSTQTQTAIDSYTWPVNGETYNQSGTYTAVIPNSVGCDSTITLNLSLDLTQIGENETSFISVFPNPTRTSFVISSEKVINSSYKLIDAQGREVLIGVIKGNNKEIDISYLSKGVYSIVFDQRDLPVLLVVKK